MGRRLNFSAILFMHALPALASRVTRNNQSEQDDSDDSDIPSVTWSSPTNGQVLAGGETLVGAWSSTNAVQSPVFSLCLISDSSSQSDGGDEDDSCGENIDPEVTQMDSGFSTMTLTVPNVSSTGSYLLRMADSDGNEFDSPAFVLTTSDLEETVPTASLMLPATEGTPLSTVLHSQAIASSSSATSSSVAAAILSSSPAFTAPTILPTAVNLRAHPPLSPLALAIPLSFVGVVIFAALLLCCAKWRRTARKRARSPEGYTRDAAAYPFAGYGAQPSLGPSQDLEKAVDRLSAVAQMRSSRMSSSFVHPQLSMLGSRAGSESSSDKYTVRPDRSHRTSRMRDNNSLGAATPYPSHLFAHRSLSMPSVESFPVDYADYSQPIASAPQPTTRRARSNGNDQTPFVHRRLYAPHSDDGRRDQAEDDVTGDIVDSYIQGSPPTSPALSDRLTEPPRIAHKPRSRPQSGDSLSYKLQGHCQDAEGQYSELGTDVYRIVSKRVQQHL